MATKETSLRILEETARGGNVDKIRTRAASGERDTFRVNIRPEAILSKVWYAVAARNKDAGNGRKKPIKASFLFLVVRPGFSNANALCGVHVGIKGGSAVKTNVSARLLNVRGYRSIWRACTTRNDEERRGEGAASSMVIA